MIGAVYVLLLFARLTPHHVVTSHGVLLLGSWAAFMLATFQFHIGVALALIVAFAAWRRRTLWAAALAPAVVWTCAPAIASFYPTSSPPTASAPWTIFSANLWAGNRECAPMIDEIHGADPDVILLQEYTYDWDDCLSGELAKEYPYRVVDSRMDPYGAAVYSRMEFIAPPAKTIGLSEFRIAEMWVVIRNGDRELSVYNLHLLPPRGRRFTTLQRVQFANLLARLRNESRPAIVAGDFNFTADSSFHRELLRAGFQEGHQLAGWGRGSTWPMQSYRRYLPGLRLDHLYLSPDLTCLRHRTGVGRGSDHRPIIATVGFIASVGAESSVTSAGHANPR